MSPVFSHKMTKKASFAPIRQETFSMNLDNLLGWILLLNREQLPVKFDAAYFIASFLTVS
jgi:hypothetical protein